MSYMCRSYFFCKLLNFYFSFFDKLLLFQLLFVFSRYGSSSPSSHTIISSLTEPFQNDILLTPRNYHSKYLYEWEAPTKPPIFDHPGEMGKFIFQIKVN